VPPCIWTKILYIKYIDQMMMMVLVAAAAAGAAVGAEH
jgi:hypothetical protein